MTSALSDKQVLPVAHWSELRPDYVLHTGSRLVTFDPRCSSGGFTYPENWLWHVYEIYFRGTQPYYGSDTRLVKSAPVI